MRRALGAQGREVVAQTGTSGPGPIPQLSQDAPWPKGTVLDLEESAPRGLEAHLRALEVSGPRRVVVSAEGEAISGEEAKRRDLRVDVVFIRSDGWSLGSPEELAHHAFALWPSEWVAYAWRSDGLVRGFAGETWQ